MFRTFKFEGGKVVKTPTYFVDNQSESIIGEEIWECSSLYKYELPGYASGLLIEAHYTH